MTPDEIRQVRVQRRLKLKTMAELVGVQTSTIASWEIGDRSPKPVHAERIEAIGRLIPDHETVRAALSKLRPQGAEARR
jgi:transcriptional regulator with XRE-family HTH domain